MEPSLSPASSIHVHLHKCKVGMSSERETIENQTQERFWEDYEQLLNTSHFASSVALINQLKHNHDRHRPFKRRKKQTLYIGIIIIIIIILRGEKSKRINNASRSRMHQEVTK